MTTDNRTNEPYRILVDVIAQNEEHDWATVRFPSGLYAKVKTSVDLVAGYLQVPNEPTDEQVEAAAKALYANKTGSERGFEHTLFRRTWLQTARIALVAAAGVAALDGEGENDD